MNEYDKTKDEGGNQEPEPKLEPELGELELGAGGEQR